MFKCYSGRKFSCFLRLVTRNLEVPMSWEIPSTAKLMELQNPKPLQYLSSHFASLHLRKEPNASTPAYRASDCKTNDLAETTKMKRRKSHTGMLKHGIRVGGSKFLLISRLLRTYKLKKNL
ncbi:uncharacterized protein LOC122061190 [Macadamia integrifolia]|uniref:uncharacterized protein LOC122061190 n=1 Tax=Macadamia integrifolia TaxID=60698 RepID=UPI001C53006A|nr:uncharacterized protein LOC122061190 [Macadamia integrifolia]